MRLSTLNNAVALNRLWPTGREHALGRLVYGVSWSVTGQLALRGMSFLTTIIVARLLGTTGFGELGMVQSSVAMFGVVAGFGLGATTTKYVAQWRRSDPDRACRVINTTAITALLSAGIVAAAAFVASDWLATAVLAQERLEMPLKAGAFLFFVLTLDGVAVATLRGFESFRRLAMVNVCRGVLTPVVAVPLILVWGVTGAISALIVGAILGLALTIFMVRRACQEVGFGLRFSRPRRGDWRILWQFSLPATGASLLVIPPTWFGQALLVRQTDGFSELGFYTAANQWLSLLIFLPSVVGAVLMPTIASSHNESPQQRVQLFRVPLLIAGAVTLLLVITCTLLSSQVLWLYGENFVDARPVFVVMMVATLFAAVNEILYQSLLGMGAPYLRLAASSVRAIVFIGCIALLVPSLLGLGLALARLAAAAVYMAVQLPIFFYQVHLFQEAE